MLVAVYLHLICELVEDTLDFQLMINPWCEILALTIAYNVGG